jgi:hypothetical protein
VFGPPEQPVTLKRLSLTGGNSFLWPQRRKASGLRVVQSAEGLNAAHIAPRQQHHRWGTEQRISVVASGPSFSFENGTVTLISKSVQFGTTCLRAYLAYRSLQEIRITGPRGSSLTDARCKRRERGTSDDVGCRMQGGGNDHVSKRGRSL